MKAFITGGTGFIGSHLADNLTNSHNNEVRCLVRSDPKWLKGKRVEFIKGGLADLASLRKGMENVDVVYHCAGVVKAATEHEFISANVEATENLLRMAQRLEVPKVVILSSLAAVGPSSGIPLNETAALQPVSRYGRSKKVMEEMITELASASSSTSITMIRPPAVYGPREQDILTLFKMAAKGWFPIIGGEKSHPVSVVHVRDLVNGIILAGQKHEQELKTYFITGEPPIQWEQFCAAASKALEKKVRPFRVKASLVQKIAAGVEKSASFFGIYPVLNEDKARELILEWTCSSRLAQEELGYQPKVSLDEGVFETIHWYKAHNWI